MVDAAVWTLRHRGHVPNGGYWLGVREVGDEEPERGDTLHDQLRDAGVTILDAADVGLDPITAVHTVDFVDFMSRAYTAWVEEGHLEDPGQPQVVPYLFATAGHVARYVAGWRPATIRVEAGLAAVDDPAAPLLVTADGFGAAGGALGALGVPTVFVQEGGYDLPRLGPLVLAVLEGFEATG